ncbi:ribokinase [Flammeovirga sp. MY04]|uniref:ribokinase n=1 Tax=Flammeovirga sp. MY04 TaxID=1191459 RepID=UPI0008265977|nr:ribokinase [Flammeovirga sp. MY04]ANQ52627.2 ribokinase [Flammeovirga sp. MY04]
MKKIIVIGSSNTDMVVKSPRIPAPGETILGGKFMQVAGGKGANQAVAAARSGGRVSFIGKIGNDTLGKEAKKGLDRENIDTTNMYVDPNNPSGVALIFVSEEGENSISVASGANDTLSPEDITHSESFIKEHDILLVQFETPMPTVRKAIEIAKKHQLKVIVNPAPAGQLPEDLFPLIDMIIPNETETELITGIKITDEKSMVNAADQLLAKGVKNVLITLGSKGVYLKNEETDTIVPAYKVNAKDTTAAGDTFCGALSVVLSNDRPLLEAIDTANASAGLSTQKDGAQTSIPYQKEVIDFIEKNTAKK